ncbi:MAG: hypothetical protein EPO13_11685 [Actinomycetota bacterium]|nr:MAG: hypothetical protein EPO13_11685 [Actinomycetota bacterium]
MATGDDFAARLRAGFARGFDVVAERRSGSRELRALRRDHHRAVAAHDRAVDRYRRRVRRLQSTSTAGFVSAGTGIAAFLAGILVGPDVVEPWAWLGLAAGGVGTWAGLDARRRVREAVPPPPPAVLLPPPPALAPTVPGAAAVARLAALRLRLAQVLPAVSRLHPDAGAELLRADCEAAPVLNALVDRLDAAHRIAADLPGTAAAAAATAAADDLLDRLAAGVDTYERLLTAAATMLAAPDLGRSTDEVLGPAVDALAAYTAGLRRSADTFRP